MVAGHGPQNRGSFMKSSVGKMAYAASMCQACGYAFCSIEDLTTHICQAGGPHKCRYCQQAFLTKQDLLAHLRTHTGKKPHICGLCNREFSRASSLKIHKRIHTGEKPFKCESCDISFTFRSSYVYHMQKEHSAKNNS